VPTLKRKRYTCLTSLSLVVWLVHVPTRRMGWGQQSRACHSPVPVRTICFFSRRGSDLPALKTVTEKASSSALHVRRILASRRVLLVQDSMSAVHPDRAWSLRPPGENAGTGQADRLCLPRPPAHRSSLISIRAEIMFLSYQKRKTICLTKVPRDGHHKQEVKTEHLEFSHLVLFHASSLFFFFFLPNSSFYGIFDFISYSIRIDNRKKL
jgi:hypothetical protein